MGAGAAVGPDQHHHGAIEPAQTLQTLFAVMHAGVFFGHHRRVKDAFTRGQINPVFFQVDCTL